MVFSSILEDLEHVDLHNNSLDGSLPVDLPSTIKFFSSSKNKISGEERFLNPFATWISCQCLAKIKELAVLDLQMNKFQVAILPHFERRKCNLRSLHLSNNKLKGSIPLALGNDKINDTFPFKPPGSCLEL
ncbi:LRR domain containing protein [Trema orientale]|uniref:LRR domain containing protein n=1 Tax=Trema orientale TaxID=63057 RepID=A0A2P5FR76_TREOI|nr:LRR domain containing protein [Trema orientale]